MKLNLFQILLYGTFITTKFPDLPYHICGIFDGGFNLVGKLLEYHQIKYTPIYAVSMGFYPYSDQKRQIKISPTAFLERIAKYSTHQ